MSVEGDHAEVARIVIGHSNTIRIHTGNIINWNMLKKHKFHPSMTSSDEVCIFKVLLKGWLVNF